MTRFFLILFSLFTIITGNSQQPCEHRKDATHPWSFSIIYDQDYTLEQLHLPWNEDRNYTMGVGLVVSFNSLKKPFICAPHYLLNKLLGNKMMNDPENLNPDITNSLMLANGTFTPDSLPATYVIRNDRPYGSITYLQTLISSTDKNKLRHYTTTFTAGIIGTQISREVQTWIHERSNENDTKAPRTPRGWMNQISNGGELTLGYTWEEERLISTGPIKKMKKTSVGGIELKHSWKYSVGYYTGAGYALNFRLGQKDPRNWTYSVNTLGSSNKVLADPKSDNYYQCKKRWEFYLFGSLRPNFILYNALLNGQFRHSVYTLSFNETRHLTFEFDGGGAISVPFDQTLATIKLRISGRSPEFKLPGRDPRWHFWGGIELVVAHL